MKTTIIQSDLKWEEKIVNLAHLSSLLDAAHLGGGLCGAPQKLFTMTGFYH
ncbi:MAG: hypothetical protein U5L72_19040 [Bacteroidales bacterium]|nr:hypothetical protein [Bacteroidales bacterium]